MEVITIPCKPYIATFLGRMYGEPVIMKGTFIDEYLKVLLLCGSIPGDYSYRIRKLKYADNIQFQLEMSGSDHAKLTHHKIIRLNRFFEKFFSDTFTNFVAMKSYMGITNVYAMDEFRGLFNLTEELISTDTLKKKIQRSNSKIF